MSLTFTIVPNPQGGFKVTEGHRTFDLGRLNEDGTTTIVVPDPGECDELEGTVLQCEHCLSMLCIDIDDEDRHCLRCGKSHRECAACDRNDGETCIECDTEYCSACFDGEEHRKSCGRFKTTEMP